MVPWCDLRSNERFSVTFTRVYGNSSAGDEIITSRNKQMDNL